MVIIVTDKTYIQANRILYMSMDEEFAEAVQYSGKYVTKYVITVVFEPLPGAQGNNGPFNNSRGADGIQTVEMKSFGKKRSVLLFREMVKQIRDQLPDALYLNQLAEKFLSMEVSEDDTDTSEICGVRKKKKRSKKVLRRAKRSNKSSRR